MMSPEHIKRLGIVIDNLPDGAMGHVSSTRLGMLSLQRNGLAIGARRTFHYEGAGSHGTHPGRYIAFGKIVIADYLKSGEGLPHHLAAVFLLKKPPVQQHFHFSRTSRFHSRFTRFH